MSLVVRRGCGLVGALLLGGLVCGDDAQPGVQHKPVAETAVLLTALKEAAAELEAALASEATFREAGGRFGQTTNFVAMLGQAIGEHPETSPLKSRCGSIRDAAAALKQARSYEASKQAWPRLQTALAGEGPELAVVPAGWTKFGGLGGLMSEFNGRTMRLRRAVRFPKDPAVESRDALAMALLASATRVTVPRNKSAAELADWAAHCDHMQQHLVRMSAYIREQKTTEARDAFATGMESCQKCHDQFKPR